MKKALFIAFAFVNLNFIIAQTVSDAVRFSVFNVGATARNIGVGGGLSAFGADFATISINPAGLGMYRRSEFTFTPTLVFNKAESSLDGDLNNRGPVSETKTNFNFNNIGVVFARRPQSTTWTTRNFAVGFNRLSNFHQRIRFEGQTTGTITDRWVEIADGFTPNQLGNFEDGLAFDVGAIFEDPNAPTFYLSDFIPEDLVTKSQDITRKGSINELTFAFAGNIKERVILGASIGVPFLNFEEEKRYIESDPNNDIPFFNQLRFTENLTTTGAGINLKLGAIIRVHQALRVGLAIHTPTAFQLEDNFTTTVSYDFDPEAGIEPEPPAESPEGIFEYNFRTPWRFIASAGILIGKRGFLTGELEYVNYDGGKFSASDLSDADDAFFDDLNEKLDNDLDNNINFRFGGEIRLDIFRLRGGLNLSGTPYADDDELDSSLSLGAGVRWEKYFLDLGYRRIMNNELYNPYVVATPGVPQPVVNIDDNRNTFLLTMGVRF